uniref:RNA-directed DNA polymerase, eukaryota, reverse transcriptase zinc-binding domain protein n=1 Tax=Tanacetum cinerariifolium TaxID=118510 RepID=A0A699H0E4_TANCI|nr:hypothetical protein [Tanacetum cinerariifolium]
MKSKFSVSYLGVQVGALPTYYISIYKAPRAVISSLEALRNKFFIEAEIDERKMTWISWKKVLDHKQDGGLGIGDHPLKFRFPRLFALETNKLISVSERKRQGIGLASFRHHPKGFAESTQWEEMLELLNTVHLSSMAGRWAQTLHGDNMKRIESWRKVVNKITNKLSSWKVKNFRFRNYTIALWAQVVKAGHGEDGDQPLKFRFPRLFALETNKLISVSKRKRQGIGLASFRHHPKGCAESTQWEEILELFNTVHLSSMAGRWAQALHGMGSFTVSFAWVFIDNKYLITCGEPTSLRLDCTMVGSGCFEIKFVYSMVGLVLQYSDQEDAKTKFSSLILLLMVACVSSKK